MEKEYVTARLFKNRSAANGMITDEQLHSDQQQTSEAQNNSQENSKTSESDENQNESLLPQSVQSIVQKALEILGLDRKE